MRKSKTDAKDYRDSSGMPPRPVSQHGSAGDSVRETLLGSVRSRSDSRSPDGLRRVVTSSSPIITSSLESDDDHASDGRVSACSCVRPTCCTVLIVLLMLTSFGVGYLTREHQLDEAAARITELEQSLGIYKAIEGGSAAWHAADYTGLRLWFFGGADASVCPDGLLIAGPRQSVASTLTSLALLLWSFIGVAIGADLFMEAIEQITSAEHTSEVALPNGRRRRVTTRVWNATVANLTLMALGSSAPEILLSVIEICTSGFYAGELSGPKRSSARRPAPSSHCQSPRP